MSNLPKGPLRGRGRSAAAATGALAAADECVAALAGELFASLMYVTTRTT